MGYPDLRAAPQTGSSRVRREVPSSCTKVGLRLLFLFVAEVLLASPVFAGGLSFLAAVDRTRISADEQVQLTLSATGEGLGAVPEPKLPPLNDFEVTGRNSSSSTQISFVNGAMSATKTVEFIYALRPTRPGNLTIGPSSIQVEGKTYTTDPIQIEVLPAGGAGSGSTPGAPPPSTAPGGQDVAEIERNLFVEASVDRRRAYVGEQVTVTYTLFTRYDLQNVQYSKAPIYTGFWAEALFDAQQLDYRRVVRNGTVFNSALLKQIALFPTSAGTKAVAQMEIGCDIPVRSRRRSFFDLDDFDFFGRAQRVTVRSDPLNVEVLPLPPGAPAGFGGAVGDYSVSLSAAPGAVAEGDPLSVKLTISGTGNLDAVREPGRPASRDFKIYDPKVGKSVQRTGNRMGGSKTFDYVFIPARAGSVPLPRFEFVYFDPGRGQYMVKSPDPVTASVSPGRRAAEGTGQVGVSREEVTEVGRDIRYIKADASDLEDHGRMLYRSWGFWSLQALPFLAVAGAFFYRRHLERLRGDVAYARRRRSRGEAARRLKTARKALSDGQVSEFHAEVHRALAQFLGDRLNVAAAGLTANDASRLLEEKNVDRSAVARVQGIFEKCDFARFASSKVQDGEMRRLFRETEAAIADLERKI